VGPCAPTGLSCLDTTDSVFNLSCVLSEIVHQPRCSFFPLQVGFLFSQEFLCDCELASPATNTRYLRSKGEIFYFFIGASLNIPSCPSRDLEHIFLVDWMIFVATPHSDSFSARTYLSISARAEDSPLHGLVLSLDLPLSALQARDLLNGAIECA